MKGSSLLLLEQPAINPSPKTDESSQFTAFILPQFQKQLLHLQGTSSDPGGGGDRHFPQPSVVPTHRPVQWIPCKALGG